MSITRTATLTFLTSILTTLVVAGSAGSASARHVWCEEASSYGCSGWSSTGTTQQTELRSIALVKAVQG